MLGVHGVEILALTPMTSQCVWAVNFVAREGKVLAGFLQPFLGENVLALFLVRFLSGRHGTLR